MSCIEWHKESDPLYQDFIFLPVFALFFPSIRFFLDTFLLEKFARCLIFKDNREDVETEKRRKRLNKFKESAWKCIYFLSAELLALSVTYDEPWLANTKYFWVGPGDQVWPDQKIKLKLKGLYMYAAGFYTYSIFALFFWETRRADFGVSMSHHIATVLLIVLSYIFRFSRVGSVVLAIHDASDVLLEIGKMSKYCGFEGTASLAFVLFAISWVILRLIYYPFWIIWSTSYEVLLTLDKERHRVDGSIYYYIFNTLLICLLVLHIYWWVLIFRMLVKQIHARGQLGEDVRSAPLILPSQIQLGLIMFTSFCHLKYTTQVLSCSHKHKQSHHVEQAIERTLQDFSRQSNQALSHIQALYRFQIIVLTIGDLDKTRKMKINIMIDLLTRLVNSSFGWTRFLKKLLLQHWLIVEIKTNSVAASSLVG